MTATDGKKRLTDVANTEQLLRIIQLNRVVTDMIEGSAKIQRGEKNIFNAVCPNTQR